MWMVISPHVRVRSSCEAKVNVRRFVLANHIPHVSVCSNIRTLSFQHQLELIKHLVIQLAVLLFAQAQSLAMIVHVQLCIIRVARIIWE